MNIQRLSKNYAKLLASLNFKKFRQKYQLFTVEGDKSISELLSSAPQLIKEIIISENRQDEKSHYPNIPIHIADHSQMSAISSMSTPPGILAVCQTDKYLNKKDEFYSDYALYLDDVRDAGNAGTIIRTAEWFGFRRVFLSQGSIDLFHPRLIQATMGSFFRIYCREISADSFKQLPRPWIGADMEGISLEKYKGTSHGTIFLGNESLGLSKAILENLDEKVKISRHPSGQTESLNVSIAAALFMYHFTSP